MKYLSLNKTQEITDIFLDKIIRVHIIVRKHQFLPTKCSQKHPEEQKMKKQNRNNYKNSMCSTMVVPEISTIMKSKKGFLTELLPESKDIQIYK